VAAHGANGLDIGLKPGAAGGVEPGEDQHRRAPADGAFHRAPFYHRQSGRGREPPSGAQLSL